MLISLYSKIFESISVGKCIIIAIIIIMEKIYSLKVNQWKYH